MVRSRPDDIRRTTRRHLVLSSILTLLSFYLVATYAGGAYRNTCLDLSGSSTEITSWDEDIGVFSLDCYLYDNKGEFAVVSFPLGFLLLACVALMILLVNNLRTYRRIGRAQADMSPTAQT